MRSDRNKSAAEECLWDRRVPVTMALTLVLVAAVLLALWLISRSNHAVRTIPGPRRWPIIGNLPQLRARVPAEAMDRLAQTFGPIYSLQLGTVPAVVVTGLDNIKQILYHKQNHFDARPNFNRYHQIFDGDKNNSLAFCDWSELQRKRRELLNDHTFPKVYSSNFKQLDQIIEEEVRSLIEDVKRPVPKPVVRKTSFNITESKAMLSKQVKSLLGNKHINVFVRLPSIEEISEEEPIIQEVASDAVDIKSKLLETTASIFLRYFCSMKTEKTQDFSQFVTDFDSIFYEVNQGYAADFLPFLESITKNNIKEMRKCSSNIREFVETKIIQDRLENLEKESEEKDYVDSLLKNVKFGGDSEMTLEKALFSLEDILGGHSAIGNFLTKLLTFVVDNEEVQSKILDEVQSVGKDFVTLEDRNFMPYTESVIMEALRLIVSPIVPHVANQDTSISGFNVEKGTVIFLNNYDLNMSPKLWEEPTKFEPARFLDPSTGSRIKPVHFLPFGGGRRSCMGYKLVQMVSFVVLANVIKLFSIRGVAGEDYTQVPIGNLALPAETFKFAFQTRSI